jgi:hypothetical protein
MFVEKLTKQDLGEFVGRKIDYHHLNGKDIYYGYTSDNDWPINNRYNEFECDDRWVKFMYKKFGEEYKKEYLIHCAKIFD